MKRVLGSSMALLLFAGAFAWGTAALSAPRRAHAESAPLTLEELRETPAEEIASWEKYDSRDYGIVTSVKNQGNTELCWAYASLAAMETNILRQGFTGKTKEELDLDEVEFAKATKGKWDDPLDLADGSENQKNGADVIWDHAGAIPIAAQFAARGQGVFETGEIESDTPQERYSSYLLRNAISCEEEVSAIKKLIAGYGGVAFTYNSGYINYDYYYATGLQDHASFIVGWDDTVSRTLFRSNSLNTPSRDGAWIVKNSYGAGAFIGGYFYLSYDSRLHEITAFDMMPNTEYDWCYNYSDKIYDKNSYQPCEIESEEAEFAAIYRAQKGETEKKEVLKGVSVGVVGTEVEISVSVYTNLDEDATNFNNKSAFDPKNGTLAATEVYTAPGSGIYTIPLTTRVELEKDSYFTVLISLTGGNIVNDSYTYRTGKTMTYAWDGAKWNGMNYPLPPYSNGVLCIKALTTARVEKQPVDLTNAVLSLPDASYIYNGAAHTPEITVELDGEAVSSEHYTVSYTDNVGAGTATVEVTGVGDYIGTARAHFTIEKAPCPANLPKEITVPDGATTLKEVELPEGWAWVAPETKLEGKVTAIAEYRGADKANFEQTTVEFEITVAPPEEGPDPDEGKQPENPENPPEENPTDPEENGGFGVGLWIGIGVGVAAALVALGSVLFTALRRKKK